MYIHGDCEKKESGITIGIIEEDIFWENGYKAIKMYD